MERLLVGCCSRDDWTHLLVDAAYTRPLASNPAGVEGVVQAAVDAQALRPKRLWEVGGRR